MLFQLKTYNPQNLIGPHSFFILSKGLNSGKPLLSPCRNCFVLNAKSEENKEFLYWLVYSLWHSRAFYQFHTGSVIPFIRIDEVKKFVQEKYVQALEEEDKQQKAIKALRTLEEQEKQYLENINLIQEAKRAIFYKYMNYYRNER